MKKIVTFVMGLAIMFGTSTVCFADGVNNDSSNNEVIKEMETKPSENKTNDWVQVGVQKGNTLYLSLDDGLNNIEKVNPDIRIRDAKIKILETQYNYDKSKSICPDSDQGTIGYDKEKNLNWQKSLNELNNEKHDRDDKLKELKNKFQGQYFNAVTDQKDMESIHAELANLDKKIEKTTLRVKLGQTTGTELDNVMAEKSGLQSRLNTTEAKLQAELLTIKQYLSIGLTKDISFSSAQKEFAKFDENGIDYRIQNAVDKNYALKKQENSITLLKTEKGISMGYSATMDVEIRGFDVSISQAREAMEDAKLSTQIKIMQGYYDLKNKEDAVQAEKLNLEIAEDNFNTAETKFKSGMVDKIEEEGARIKLDQQKNKYQAAINDYMVTSESFKNLMEE